MQAFLFYIDDWLSSKNIEMMDALEERGYLRLLLRAAKEDDCGLPDDDSRLAIMSLLGPQWWRPTADKSRRVGALTSGDKLRKCFVIRDSRLYNDRLLREFENQQKVRMARDEAGKLGGRPRQNESNRFTYGLSNGKQTETNHSLGLEFSPEVDLSKEIFLTDFEVFWQIYPKKVGKPAALRDWNRKARTPALAEEIVGGLRIRLNELISRDRQYQPNPSTWLHQERWKDEIPVNGNGNHQRESATERAIRVGLENVARTGRL